MMNNNSVISNNNLKKNNNNNQTNISSQEKDLMRFGHTINLGNLLHIFSLILLNFIFT